MEKKKNLNYNIYLTGFMAAGKTSAAAELSRLYRMEVVDTDRIIEKEAGCSINEIFAKYGEEHFRHLETEVMRRLSLKKNLIVSCGGGVPLREENTAYMKKGKVVLLQTSVAEMIRRIRFNDKRPLASSKSDEEIIALYEQRKPIYEAAADIIVDTSDKSREEVAKEIMEQMV